MWFIKFHFVPHHRSVRLRGMIPSKFCIEFSSLVFTNTSSLLSKSLMFSGSERVSNCTNSQQMLINCSQLASIPKNLCGNGIKYLCPEEKFASSPRELHDRKGTPDLSWSQRNAGGSCSKSLASAFYKEEPHEGKGPDCSPTLVTVVRPDLPAYRVVCLGMCRGRTYFMRVAREG